MAAPNVPAPAPVVDPHVAARARSRAVGAAVVAAAPRLALVQAARLRRPVAITTKLFTIAAVCVLAGGVAAGAGLLAGLGTTGGVGPALVVLAGALYALPLFLLVSCRNALASYPQFLDVLERESRTAVPDAASAPSARRRRAPVRVLHATRSLLRGAAVPVRAAARAAGVWRLASPVVSAGGAIAFVATPALLLTGLATLAAGIALA